MTTRAVFAAATAAFAYALLGAHPLSAQAPYGNFPQGFAPTAYNTEGPLMDAHGNPAVIPAQYCQGGCPGGCPGGCGGGYCGGYGGPTPCDPFMGAGAVCEQCGPHYFDFSLDYLTYWRNSYGKANFDLASDGVIDPMLPGGGGVVQVSTNEIPEEGEPGFRLTGRYDLAALTVVEFGYAGFFDMGGSSVFADPNPDPGTGLGNIYSLYSNFGLNPNPPESEAPAFDETDRATFAGVGMDSELMTGEISFRRYWVGHSPRISGTWMAGFRWTRLKDQLAFYTANNAGASFTNLVEAENDLSGFQTGFDAWIVPRQGFRFGIDTRHGIYGNKISILNRYDTADGGGNLVDTEFRLEDEPAYIGELRLMAAADICPNFTVKVGYELLYLSTVATALDNFNPGSPYLDGTGAPVGQARIANQFRTQSDALFHGLQASVEYIW